MLKAKILTQKDQEGYARLTAPQHIRFSRFSAHEKIQGYFENIDVPEFMSSDRLLRLDTLYGTIQMGYNPQKGQSFIFANIKQSIFDTAPARHQKELKEYQMMRELKSGTPNIIYNSKRRAASAIILYKTEPMPWTRRSVEPYLRRVNMEALQKTMPFLDRAEQLSKRQGFMQEQKNLQLELAGKMSERKYNEMADIRARQTQLIAQQNMNEALIYRKSTQERLFFRRLNGALDIQKHEMYAYYRDRRRGGAQAKTDTAPEQPKPDGDKDE